MKKIFLQLASIFFLSATSGQYAEKVIPDAANGTNYYTVVRPVSARIDGTLVLLTSFLPAEMLLRETKLQSIASANNFLTVVVFMQQKLYADSVAVNRLNQTLSDVVARFKIDTSRVALAGYDEAGGIALRYTELAHQHPTHFPVRPKAVFGIDTPVDLFGLWHWSENQIRKNYWPGAVGDAKFYLDAMTKENGTIYDNAANFQLLTPFNRQDSIGNEQYLKRVAVRLYYDIDINWHLQNRRNSFYDTKLPDGSELVKRLLLAGNDKAELVVARQPGMRSDGMRTPSSISIVDEVECVQWLKQSLGIFDHYAWKPPYYLPTPSGWNVERFSLPPDFAPDFYFSGVEDVRFAPGWENINSDEHWSYCFLWWIEGKQKIDAVTLQTALKEYYTGLVRRNISSRNIPANKIVPVITAIRKMKARANDLETYSGTIKMLDYHTQEPMDLNCSIHVKDSELPDRTAVYFEISPNAFTHPVWQQLHEIGEKFRPKS